MRIAVLGTGDPAATRAREDWVDVASVELTTFADATVDAEIVVHAGNGLAALDLLRAAGDLSGAALVDISNPLDFSGGLPPTLTVLNTLTAGLMVHPETLAEATSVFVSGDDADAKTVVTSLLTQLGHTDVIDLGGIETTRGPEMWMPLWLRLMGSLGTGDFNLRIVR